MGDQIGVKVEQERFEENVSKCATLQPIPLATVYMMTESPENREPQLLGLDDGVVSNNLVKDPEVGVSSSSQTRIPLDDDSSKNERVPSDIQSKPKQTHPGSSDSLSAMVADRECKRVGSVADNGNAMLLPGNSKEVFKCHLKEQPASGFGLKRHLLVHNVAGPHNCKEGRAPPPIAQLLKRHQHMDSNRRVYECDTCQATFIRRNDLVIHLKIHTVDRPFKCNMCRATFVRQDHLVAHLEIHARVRPFKCNMCLATFCQRKYLVAHLKIHTGERPIKCDTCHAAFLRRNQLILHLKIHTGKRPLK